ncbi:solute carrier family 66 member 2-like isoform X2 [Watersipora subatra]|uniref:solute carrier family 66 member 2-like isoform X2 n=1 Tax=Watersipora subatra TaxID=2589382 RepID=UPI00355B32FE
MDFQRYVSQVDLSKMTLADLISTVAAAAMVFGGVVPYIPQYRTIRRTLNCDGFSTFVCFVLIIANILRVFFWFGKRFEAPLLAQSILMIAAMLAMVEVCVRVKNKSEIIQGKQHSLRGLPVAGSSHSFYHCLVDLDWTYFWRWTDFLSYVEFVLLVSAILSLTTYIFIDNDVYVESVGFLAVFIEAMLGTPQLHKNYTNKSTKGMSVSMVVMWLSGDTFKTGYFIIRESPMQFWLCGTLQICVDLLILSQVLYYSLYPSRGAALKHSS